MNARDAATNGKRGRHGEHGDTIVKRAARRTHDDDHGGNWKVAFADFCLALMCLFLLLWVLAARDEEETRVKLIEMTGNAMVEGGSGMFDGAAAPGLLRSSDSASSGHFGDSAGVAGLADEAALERLAAQFEQLGVDTGLRDNLRTVATPFGLRVMLHDSDARGVFERGSASPSPPFRPLLHRMGALFAQAGNPLIVVGHTDSVPYRGLGLGGRSNWHLSIDRAMSARRALLDGGMPSAHVLQVIGMADRGPLSDDSRAAHNRRIEFLVLTPEHARAIAQMFGRPQSVVPLAPGIDAASASDDAAGAVGMAPMPGQARGPI
ncbi:hypothetical protein WL21_04835 [Burkholderia ubonensis]|uniref:flagellar motor protein MotB n=1 Tax=Burkholderia ubonensis TaxID=101571 RepID=UPI000758140D|nr:flagellar motor protein MotB [Burkholderia ubonensis]KVO87709.1 hypothetical protein WJ81_15805 [Burkholderia ubonensis]KVZ57326.1 hypothetical protein WL20_23590 [Burkholderia ubonensis]KVZ73023.1 hypothetical protein WL21_04835 [Burkholderia ubonensis]